MLFKLKEYKSALKTYDMVNLLHFISNGLESIFLLLTENQLESTFAIC